MASPKIQPTKSCHVVALPYPGRGHINPMLNVCKALAQSSSSGILITVVVTEEWRRLLESDEKPSNLIFATIPNVLPSERTRGADFSAFFAAVLTKMEQPVERLLDELEPPALIIADAILNWAAEVGERRNIPMAYMWPMAASIYTVFYHFDLIVQNGHSPVDDASASDCIIDYIPGLPPTSIADLPPSMRTPESMAYMQKLILHHSRGKCLIFSSLYHLESPVIDSLIQNFPTPIYNIAPVTAYSALLNAHNSHSHSHYTTWLDLHPPSSVLYVSLGSHVSVPRAQLQEMALGLHKSGIRFLWVVRESAWIREVLGDDDAQGRLVEWCDQLTVLSHPSVGGFWSHCGWNSTKEAVLCGVPMLGSPVLIDQFYNVKAVVEEWRIGWRVGKGVFGEGVLVKGEEIGEMVRKFMDLESEDRREMDERVTRLKEMCKMELEGFDANSFRNNLDSLLRFILQD